MQDPVCGYFFVLLCLEDNESGRGDPSNHGIFVQIIGWLDTVGGYKTF